MRGLRDGAKRKKDSWAWSTVWRLLGVKGEGIRGLNDNGKNTIFEQRTLGIVFKGQQKRQNKCVDERIKWEKMIDRGHIPLPRKWVQGWLLFTSDLIL